MFEKFLVPVYVFFLIITNQIPLDHNSWIDRVDPAIPEVISYAQVPKNTQKYFNVQAYDSKTGRKLPYKIKKVGGYDPSRQYIKIVHKGQYVKEIKYISKKEFQKKVHS